MVREHHLYDVTQPSEQYITREYQQFYITRPHFLSERFKNEVGCRDDTVPKTVDTRRQLRACNNLPQPLKTRLGCRSYLHAPCGAFLYQQFWALSSLHPTSFLINVQSCRDMLLSHTYNSGTSTYYYAQRTRARARRPIASQLASHDCECARARIITDMSACVYV